MDFALTEVQASLKREALTVASSFGLDYWREHDREASYPWEFVRAFAEAGWLGAVIPEAYGGSGLGVVEAGLLLHAVGRSGAGTSGASAIHFYIFPLTPVIRHGSEHLKRSYLPLAARGELLCAFGVTEPTAGTDTSRISTRAERHADRWIVNGQKVWTTNAQHADRILLLARTSPRRDEAPLEGLTLFFTNFDRSACTVRKIDKLGRAAVDSNEVFIDGLEVPDEDVVGEVGRGFYHLLDGLNPERVVNALEAVGMGQWALEYAARYACDRRVFDRPIGQNQAVAHPLARAWAELEAAELLAYKAAWLLRLWTAVWPRSQCRQSARRRRRLPRLRRRDADPGWLRLLARVPRRARVARDSAVQDRADHAGDGAQLPGRARPGAAEILLTYPRGASAICGSRIRKWQDHLP